MGFESPFFLAVASVQVRRPAIGGAAVFTGIKKPRPLLVAVFRWGNYLGSDNQCARVIGVNRWRLRHAVERPCVRRTLFWVHRDVHLREVNREDAGRALGAHCESGGTDNLTVTACAQRDSPALGSYSGGHGNSRCLMSKKRPGSFNSPALSCCLYVSHLRWR
jgi:hypothetical protein